jgi:sigma-B regulation protein RsbU (phosphoserine phosphatase)
VIGTDGGPSYRLRVQVGTRQMGHVALGRTHLAIGRSPRAQLTIDDPFASRLHAEMWTDGEACWLSDLGSSNGTYLNGGRVSGAMQVFPGDQVRIGETQLTVEQAGEATRPATAPLPLHDSRASRELSALLASVQRAAGTQAPAAPPPARDLFALVSKAGVALLSPSGLDAVLPAILDLVFDGIPAERAFLLLRDRDGGVKVRAASTRKGGRTGSTEVKISREVQRQVLEERRSLLSTDAQVDERFKARESVILSGVRSIMAVPLQVGDQVLGMAYVDSPLEVRPFTREDLQVLTTIAGVAAIKVENEMLLAQRIENARLHEELQKAREIQLRLLPQRPPEPPGYELAGMSFPSQAVGGDYFDFVPLESGSVLLAVGDVAGKGLDAALAMSSLHACVRSQAQAGRGVGELVKQVNRYLCDHLPYNKFATLFCGVLDPVAHQLSYVNAGHNPPLLVGSDGTVRELEATGMPTGLSKEGEYAVTTVDFAAGDLLLAYSDGVTDASAEELGGEPLGSEGLARMVAPLRGMAPRELLDRLDEELETFLGGREPDDDLTMVAVKRAG